MSKQPVDLERSAAKTVVLVRLGAEITLKARRTRTTFVKRLIRNIGDALDAAGAAHAIDDEWGRLFVRLDEPSAPPVLARVFGLSSYSVVDRVVPADLDAIVEAGIELYAGRVGGRFFAVRARRTGRHGFTSRDIEVELGAALLPSSGGVRLDDPEFTAHVEVRDRVAYLFSSRAEAAGGLPLGVEGRAVALLSGGFDSAVAAWLVMKRGVGLDYVFCNLGGDAYERAVLQLAKVLGDEWSYGTNPRLHVVDFGEPVRAMRENAKPAYWQVVLKRLMYRTASRIGEETGASAIVTGESLGQVSSQTLSNLRSIEPAADLPVFRPVIGFDKGEIVARARAIGTATLSEQVREYCALAPGHPVTASTPDRVAAEERLLGSVELDAAIAGRKVLDLRALAPTDLVAPYLFTDEIPQDAVVFDCRTAAQFRAWHLPGAVQRDEWDLLRSIDRLDRDKTYVLYCAHGIQTAYLAERMQRAGIEAHSFRGGMRSVLEYARRMGTGPV